MCPFTTCLILPVFSPFRSRKNSSTALVFPYKIMFLGLEHVDAGGCFHCRCCMSLCVGKCARSSGRRWLPLVFLRDTPALSCLAAASRCPHSGVPPGSTLGGRMLGPGCAQALSRQTFPTAVTPSALLRVLPHSGFLTDPFASLRNFISCLILCADY